MKNTAMTAQELQASVEAALATLETRCASCTALFRPGDSVRKLTWRTSSRLFCATKARCNEASDTAKLTGVPPTIELYQYGRSGKVQPSLGFADTLGQAPPSHSSEGIPVL